MRTRTALACLACTAAFLLLGASCSSAPRRVLESHERKNEAAGYIRLADGFFGRGQYEFAMQYYREALEANLSVDYVEGAILARSSLGRVYMLLAAEADAERELQDALFDAELLGNRNLLALCWNNLGELRYRQGRVDEAAALFADAVATVGNDDKLRAVIAHNVGVVSLAGGNLDEAAASFNRARQANERAKRWSEYAANSYMLASIENQRGNLELAITWAERALAADRRAENSLGIAADLEALGRLNRKAERQDLAFDYFRRAFYVALQLNDVEMVSRCLDQMILAAAAMDRTDLAERYQDLRERL